MSARTWRNREACALLVGAQKGAAAAGPVCLRLQKPRLPQSPGVHSGNVPERMASRGSQRCPAPPPPAAPPTAAGGPQATIRGWTEKQNVVCPHGGMSVSFKEDGNSDTREVRRTQNDKRCLAPLTGGRWRGHSRSQREGRVTGWGGEAGEGRDWLTGTEF